jgi:hypothetical protein
MMLINQILVLPSVRPEMAQPGRTNTAANIQNELELQKIWQTAEKSSFSKLESKTLRGLSNYGKYPVWEICRHH